MFFVPMGRQATDFSRSLERLFDEHLFERNSASAATDANTHTPALDVTDTESAYTLQLDLPGVAKADVKVQIDGRRVQVMAERSRATDQQDSGRLIHRERSIRRYLRSVTLPQDIDQSASSAKLEDGVLTLQLVKRGTPTASQLTVN